jgi:predicted helicase
MPDDVIAYPQLETPIATYLKALREQKMQATSTGELAYRTHLENFLREVTTVLGVASAKITNEPRAIEIGRPDFAVMDGGVALLGYIEAEAMGANLDKLTGSAKEQNERFRENLHNFLQTNHLHFKLFKEGKLVAEARLPESGTVSASDRDALGAVFERFFGGATVLSKDANQIAKQMARRARLLRFAAEKLLTEEDSFLHSSWEAYRTALESDIDAKTFADVYAQTFTYGLFLSWLSTEGNFDRTKAINALPHAVPPIRALLQQDYFNLEESLAWIIEGICADLNRCDRTAILSKFQSSNQDPMIHFYEPFLAAYDAKLREARGSYYTPDPVVDFIVRAVDELLVSVFGKEGLQDESVRLLDPATGTATFLARCYRQVQTNMQQSGDGGMWQERAQNHLAKHFYGFELMPAAYTLAHLKLRTLLKELGAPIEDKTRLPIYLCNALDEGNPPQSHLPLVKDFSEEIRAAGGVKKQRDILVVIGNPPYFGKSSNPDNVIESIAPGAAYQKDMPDGTVEDRVNNSSHNLQNKRRNFIGRLLHDYYFVDETPLGEKNPKWLQDDYVKFTRLAEHLIAQSGQGIVAFITNHGYLDNPTFKGMRRHLMRTFDEVRVLDLHGNSKKKEHGPNGGKEENVFDIQQGVAICFLIRKPGSTLPLDREGKRKDKSSGRVFHAELWGTRDSKYATLEAATVENIAWHEITPTEPAYLFVPQDTTLKAEYNDFWNVQDIFPVNSMGVTTGSDKEKVDFVTNKEEKILVKYYYRPFDIRFIIKDKDRITRARMDTMKHLEGSKNLALISMRGTRSLEIGNFFVVSGIVDKSIVSSLDNAYVFPLWLNPNVQNGQIAMDRRRPNLSDAFLNTLNETLDEGKKPTPEQIFHYIYAILHAPTYRTRYADFLKRDFPRIPLPPNQQTFDSLSTLGAKLVSLHLLEDTTLKQHGISYPIGGDNIVTKVKNRYDANLSGGRVYFNDTQYCENIPPHAYEMRIGGYQPAQKWIDDRVGRTLTSEDINHYRRFVAALRETHALLPQVDKLFVDMVG